MSDDKVKQFPTPKGEVHSVEIRDVPIDSPIAIRKWKALERCMKEVDQVLEAAPSAGSMFDIEELDPSLSVMAAANVIFTRNVDGMVELCDPHRFDHLAVVAVLIEVMPELEKELRRYYRKVTGKKYIRKGAVYPSDLRM